MTILRDVEVIVVGGGPAGSAAASRLRAGGADVLVLDKERFPRLKLCAGWITPQVVADLALEVDCYPHSFLTFERLHWHLKALHLPVRTVQHSIRRFEFDAWLLERSGAETVQHTVKNVRRDGADYVIDDAFRCRYLIGAGGTSCPVRRCLFGSAGFARVRALQTVTLELEFPFDWQDGECHLWFFERGLPGYSWYVPKARGWLNVGIGAMAARLKERGEDIWQHWHRFATHLERRFRVRVPGEPGGYSYYVRSACSASRIDNAFLTGDSAGLATRDMCEGIGPAIRSGQRAAEAIIGGRAYDFDADATSLGTGLVSRALDWAFTRGASPSRAIGAETKTAA